MNICSTHVPRVRLSLGIAYELMPERQMLSSYSRNVSPENNFVLIVPAATNFLCLDMKACIAYLDAPRSSNSCSGDSNGRQCSSNGCQSSLRLRLIRSGSRRSFSRAAGNTMAFKDSELLTHGFRHRTTEAQRLLEQGGKKLMRASG